jgi:hypothetical protein
MGGHGPPWLRAPCKASLREPSCVSLFRFQVVFGAQREGGPETQGVRHYGKQTAVCAKIQPAETDAPPSEGVRPCWAEQVGNVRIPKHKDCGHANPEIAGSTGRRRPVSLRTRRYGTHCSPTRSPGTGRPRRDGGPS